MKNKKEAPDGRSKATSGKKDDGTQLREKAESIYKDKQAQHTFEGLSSQTINELFHELGVHQIELEMQNDELRKTRDSLELSRAKYFDLYELAPVGYLTLDNNGIILEANLTSAKILGLSRDKLVKYPFSKFIYNEDFAVYYKNHKLLLDNKIPQSYEIRISNSPGKPVWVLLDINILQYGDFSQLARVIISDISENKNAQEKISWLLKEKDIVLQEVHHRIKNNLNTVMGVLSIHAHNLKDADSVIALQDAKSRVNTMLVLYNKLYVADDFLKISLKDYLSPLIDEIICLYPNLANIKLNTSLDNVAINAKLLPTIGIIVNELITNIAKYAFKGRDDGEIAVFASVIKGHIKLTIKDNGIGIENLMELKTSKGLGLQLVNLLTDQLDGKLTIDGEKGTSFILEFDTGD